MTILDFVKFFALFLLLAAFVISGFYIITRGQKSVQPDGTIRTKGKIFKRWSLFWEKTTGSTRFYYCGRELAGKLVALREYHSALGQKLDMQGDQKSVRALAPLLETELSYIREVIRCEIEFDKGDNSRFLLYVEEPDYYFPEWLRFPLSQCPPCMASVGGTLLYWPVVISSPTLFAWTSQHIVALQVYFWILFCLALSALNKLAYNVIGE